MEKINHRQDFGLALGSVPDPNPNPDRPDPQVFRPPGSSYHQEKIVMTSFGLFIFEK
jgi:hypothetical protein